MCTLAVSFRPGSPFPLTIAANRDEHLSRPASPPRLWPGERFVAPRDELAGGTWLGLTDHGLFVGVTNRFGAPKDGARESRGTLVLEALRASSAAALHATLARTPPSRFNAFHLLYADADGAFVTWCDGEELRQHSLPPGLHVVTERSLGGDDHGRAELVRALWPEPRGDGLPPIAELESLLRQHRDGHVGGTCLHVPELGYGTRSSLVLLVAARLADSRFFWADGAPPCAAPFQEHAELVRAILGYAPLRN